MVLLGCPLLAIAQTGANDPARYRPEPQRVAFKGPDGSTLQLTGMFWRPPQGEGPFPLVVLSHGSDAEAAGRRRMTVLGYWNAARYFLNRGFAVLYVLRPSYGDSEGPYLEANVGNCNSLDYGPGFEAMADVIAASLAHARSLPQLDLTRLVLVGHSAGGAASIAMAARRPAGLVTYINFGGGKGGSEQTPYSPCSAGNVEKHFSAYARSTDVPALWLYAQNDLYFGRDVAPRWHAAYQAAGGRAQLVMTEPAPDDKAGHHIVQQHLPLWIPAADSFLRQQGFQWGR
ncbi:dienelactone hydrolase family protein [Viridibacterium curvum]|uniref:Dienelactone hydrolase family protein n=2 Tax=Viridibacterium curvum TaxID=1101404 RepID=A0ABP9QZI2_9RHOO